jgi:hypothetical protein
MMRATSRMLTNSFLSVILNSMRARALHTTHMAQAPVCVRVPISPTVSCLLPLSV